MNSPNNSGERRAGVLRRHAGEIRNYKIAMKVLTTALIMILILLIILYMVSALYMQTGSFTVRLSKVENQRYGLTLADNREMKKATSQLNAKIAEDITNIAEETLPDNLDMIDGSHNGENYIAYTFYLQNAGDVPLAYDYTLTVTGISNDLDEAIRVRLYKDGVATTYAKTASDGSGPEPGTTEFYSQNWVAHARVEEFQPQEMTKFTVVVWIEGNDPDCIDYLIGGQLKLDMIMEVVH